MRSRTHRTTTLLLATISLAFSACATTAPPLSATLDLTQGDRTPTPSPEPAIPVTLPPVTGAAKAERDFLMAVVIKPLMDVSLAQEKAKQAETQRANGVVAKVDAHNKVIAPKGWRWPWARGSP